MIDSCRSDTFLYGIGTESIISRDVHGTNQCEACREREKPPNLLVHLFLGHLHVEFVSRLKTNRTHPSCVRAHRMEQISGRIEQSSLASHWSIKVNYLRRVHARLPAVLAGVRLICIHLYFVSLATMASGFSSMRVDCSWRGAWCRY